MNRVERRINSPRIGRGSNQKIAAILTRVIKSGCIGLKSIRAETRPRAKPTTLSSRFLPSHSKLLSKRAPGRKIRDKSWVKSWSPLASRNQGTQQKLFQKKTKWTITSSTYEICFNFADVKKTHCVQATQSQENRDKKEKRNIVRFSNPDKSQETETGQPTTKNYWVWTSQEYFLAVLPLQPYLCPKSLPNLRPRFTRALLAKKPKILVCLNFQIKNTLSDKTMSQPRGKTDVKAEKNLRTSQAISGTQTTFSSRRAARKSQASSCWHEISALLKTSNLLIFQILN